MPELAEVEYYRRQWDPGVGAKVKAVELHATKRIFRGVDLAVLENAITGGKLVGSEAKGKQMLFQFSGGGWLGIHLGMTGHLRAEPAGYLPQKHDHLVLQQTKHALVFEDFRMFGRVTFDLGKSAPHWWTDLPPSLVSDAFTVARLQEILARRTKSSIKAALLDQAIFPGVGNWMADEILWQAKIHPATRCGLISPKKAHALWEMTQHVCTEALRTIGITWGDPPAGWLFHVRWKTGGHCPRDKYPLDRQTIAGRTTAWCPHCQPAPSLSPKKPKTISDS